MWAHVDEVGYLISAPSTAILLMQKCGVIYLNPSNGGLLVPVQNTKSFSFCSVDKDFRWSQKLLR